MSENIKEVVPPGRKSRFDRLRRVMCVYPHGCWFTLTGHWLGALRQEGTCFVLMAVTEEADIDGNVFPKDAMFCGDPRGLYLDADNGRILYNPQAWLDGMAEPWLEWLTTHRDWPTSWLLAPWSFRLSVNRVRGPGSFREAMVQFDRTRPGLPVEEFRSRLSDLEWEDFGEIRLD